MTEKKKSKLGLLLLLGLGIGITAYFVLGKKTIKSESGCPGLKIGQINYIAYYPLSTELSDNYYYQSFIMPGSKIIKFRALLQNNDIVPDCNVTMTIFTDKINDEEPYNCDQPLTIPNLNDVIFTKTFPVSAFVEKEIRWVETELDLNLNTNQKYWIRLESTGKLRWSLVISSDVDYYTEGESIAFIKSKNRYCRADGDTDDFAFEICYE